MPLVMPRPQMPLLLRYTSAVSLFGLLFTPDSCRHYLDSLAKKYHVAPFWKQCGGKRTETIRITLNAEEKQHITKTAAIHGNGQTVVFAQDILLREANRILRNDMGGKTR